MKSKALSAIVLISLLSGCLTETKKEGGSSPRLVGRMFLSDGKPASGALIKAYAVDHLPMGSLAKAGADSLPVFSAYTDADGRYEMDPLPPNLYNFLGESDGSYSFMDSVEIKTGTRLLPSNTLDLPGSLTSRVVLEPNHDPRSAFVQILGTNRYAVTDSAGWFTFGDLAEGDYSMRITSTKEDYRPVFAGFQVRAGHADTLETPHTPAFLGIPVIRGLSAIYDTSAESARISWNPSRLELLKEYVVYRKPALSTGAPQAVAAVRDTFYRDDLSAFTRPESLTVKTPERFEYSVRVRNLSEDEGAFFRSTEVFAAPRFQVSTRLAFRILGRPDSIASIFDTTRIVATWSNPTRGNRSLTWFDRERRDTLRSVEVQGREGADTLALVIPGIAADIELGVRIVDEAGEAWIGTYTVDVVTDSPKVGLETSHFNRDLFGNLTITVSDTVRLRGVATQGFGRIVKWEWDIGAKGVYIEGSGPDTVLIGPADVRLQKYALRVTDDDGNTASDSLELVVLNDIPKINLNSRPWTLENGAGYLLHAGFTDFGKIVKWEWDVGNTGLWIQGSGPDTILDSWKIDSPSIQVKVRGTDDDGNVGATSASITLSKWRFIGNMPLPEPFSAAAVAELDGLIYVLSSPPEGDPWGSKPSFHSYDPANGAWKTLAHFHSLTPGVGITTVTKGHRLAAMNGKIYCIVGGSGMGSQGTPNAYQFYVYDPDAGFWSSEANLDKATNSPGTAVLGGKLYVAGGLPNRSPSLDEFDPGQGVWAPKANLPDPIQKGTAVAAGGKLYVMGGGTDLLSYSTATDSWTGLAPMPIPKVDPSAVVLAGRIYVLGSENGDLRVPVYDIAQDSWAYKSSMLFPTQAQTSVACNGKIYSFSNDLKIQVYDPAMDP